MPITMQSTLDTSIADANERIAKIAKRISETEDLLDIYHTKVFEVIDGGYDNIDTSPMINMLEAILRCDKVELNRVKVEKMIYVAYHTDKIQLLGKQLYKKYEELMVEAKSGFEELMSPFPTTKEDDYVKYNNDASVQKEYIKALCGITE